MIQQGRAAVVSVASVEFWPRVRALASSKAELNAFLPTNFLPIPVAERTGLDASKSNDVIYKLKDDLKSKSNRLVEW